MKHVFTISCAAFMSLVLLVTSCKKGDTGPAGPEGPAGPAGPQGPKGDTGVANVIYSNWLDVAFDPAIDTTTGDTVFFDAVINAPKLTADIINKGDVKVYWNANTAAQPFVWPLPLNDLVVGITPIYSINVAFIPGQIYLYSESDASSFTAQGQKAWQYRYVLIPGGKAARSAINWNDYAAVKAYLGLKD